MGYAALVFLALKAGEQAMQGHSQRAGSAHVVWQWAGLNAFFTLVAVALGAVGRNPDWTTIVGFWLGCCVISYWRARQVR